MYHCILHLVNMYYICLFTNQTEYDVDAVARVEVVSYYHEYKYLPRAHPETPQSL